MEHFDLLFQQMNDIGVIQQEMQQELTSTKEDQKLIAKQVQDNGLVVATLTLKQMENEALSDHLDDNSVIFDDEEPPFDNIFGKNKHEDKAVKGSYLVLVIEWQT